MVTGYRYYNISQVETGLKIKSLSILGFSLEQISEFLIAWDKNNKEKINQITQNRLNEIRVEKKKLAESYDRKRKCYVIDIKKLNKAVISIIKSSKKNLILDSHLSHYIPKKYIDLCIITKCNLKTLEKRLKNKKYHKAKIKENLECEIFDICLNEAKELKHKILIIDTTKRLNMNSISKTSGDLPIIEDCAHSLFSRYKGRETGTLSLVSFFSFRSGKYISAGEGSAILCKDTKLNKSIYKGGLKCLLYYPKAGMISQSPSSKG